MATKKRTPAKRKPAKPAKKAKASAAPKAIKKTASFVTLFDMKIEVERRGKGRPLVLIPGEGPPTLLALLARDPRALDPAQGAGALAFLGRAIAAALGR